MIMVSWFARSRKSVTALVVGIIGWFELVPDLHHISRGSWIGLAVLIASALGVYTVSNDPAPADQLTSSAKDAGYVYQDPGAIVTAPSAPAGPQTGTPGSSMPQEAVQQPPQPGHDASTL
jgi:hypothetical protein